MGYNTDFIGELTILPALNGDQILYIQSFSDTRHMKRDVAQLEENPSSSRVAVGLPVGVEGEYVVDAENPDYDSITAHNQPTESQPGLWCQWTVGDGYHLFWDGGEKFYSYIQWMTYMIERFFIPWGKTLNGEIEWIGEDSSDHGRIVVTDNVITTENLPLASAEGEEPDWADVPYEPYDPVMDGGEGLDGADGIEILSAAVGGAGFDDYFLEHIQKSIIDSCLLPNSLVCLKSNKSHNGFTFQINQAEAKAEIISQEILGSLTAYCKTVLDKPLEAGELVNDEWFPETVSRLVKELDWERSDAEFFVLEVCTMDESYVGESGFIANVSVGHAMEHKLCYSDAIRFPWKELEHLDTFRKTTQELCDITSMPEDYVRAVMATLGKSWDENGLEGIIDIVIGDEE